MKRTLPELRKALLTMADDLDAALPLSTFGDELRQIAAETIRKSPARPRAPNIHPPLTDQQKQAVVAFAFSSAGRKMHIADIARRFNVNPGRVSEAVHGAGQ